MTSSCAKSLFKLALCPSVIYQYKFDSNLLTSSGVILHIIKYSANAKADRICIEFPLVGGGGHNYSQLNTGTSSVVNLV